MKKRISLRLKKWTLLALCCAIVLAVLPLTAAADSDDSWAIYWYLCGSDLESEHGSATEDLIEMLEVELPDDVKIVIETGGAYEWQNEMVDANYLERYVYDSEDLKFLEQVKLASMGETKTLVDFLTFCRDNYPAKHKVHLLTRQRIKGKEYLCRKCQDKCSPDLTEEEYVQMSPEDVRANMTHMETCERLYKEKFDSTDSVKIGWLDEPLFSADLNHGWWMHKGSNDIYGLDMVKSWRFGMDTSPLSEDERREEEEKGIFESLLDALTDPEFDRDDMHPCPRGRKVDNMYVDIFVEHHFVKKIRIQTMESWSDDPDDVHNGYEAAAEIMDFLEEHSGTESDPIE